MLASTVQFSSYGRARTPTPPPAAPEGARYEQGVRSAEATGLTSPFPQDPTACPTTDPAPASDFHTPKGCTHEPRAGAAELVSHPGQ
jgi:hypothetical protein